MDKLKELKDFLLEYVEHYIINTYNLWDVLDIEYCQIRLKTSVIELIDYTYNEPILNHLKYHYWEQLNILEVDNGGRMQM